ncbi:MAG: deoxyribonuclease IV [Parachlamydiales bacterium]|jgi:deoxyribonuclease-4
MKKTLFIGAHMSIEGGLHNALLRGQAIGANVIQIFTANQRQWKTKKITLEELALWKEAKKNTAITHIMSHASYLINLGSSKKELLEKSRRAFLDELERCHQLDLDYLNFHPGAALGFSEEECLQTILESLLSFELPASRGRTELLIELTSGQGTVTGYLFEQLGFLISHLHRKLPIGVCIDTCHAFAAGYDLRTEEALSSTLKAFEQKIGLKYLRALHLNDTFSKLGERKDRHAPIGQGLIGLKGFEAIMQHPRLSPLPKYLETPDPGLWEDEIKLLHKLGEKHAH